MFEQKKIFILGMARSGYEAAKFLSAHHNQIFVTDAKEQDEARIEELRALGVTFEVLEHPEEVLDSSYDYLIKNPGIRSDQACVVKAKELGIPVINEMEVAYHFLQGQVTIIGVTGSNGKTTTTSLLYQMLKEDGKRVQLGGNIGYPLCSLVDQVKQGDILVLEISDHQLVDLDAFKTNISIMTNLSPVHLDFHGTYERYQNVKKKIFAHHTEADYAIVNAGNSDVMHLCEDIPSTKITFSAKQEADCKIQDGKICYQGKPIIATNEISLKGAHNYENAMCALLAALNVGCSFESILKVLKNFKGVEHRLEYVRTVQGVAYYNDSKSTNVDSTIIALSSFHEPTVLLLGGLDRGHSFLPLNPYLQHVTLIGCFGETKDRIAAWAFDQGISCIKRDTLEEVMNAIKDQVKEQDVVLFSPACASWDQYARFEDRGDEFKKLVAAL